jgi:uncharacterized short protein YbdD (DUF466 family)
MRPLGELLKAGAAQGAYLGKALARVAGAPDYAAYLARHRELHPDTPPLDERAFHAWALERRFSSAGVRCC